MAQKVAYVTGAWVVSVPRFANVCIKMASRSSRAVDHPVISRSGLASKSAGLYLLCIGWQCGDWDSTVEAFSKTKAEHGAIDVLVNNAGITRDRMFVKMTPDDWHAVIETNLNSMFNVTKQVVADMVEKGWGASSTSARSMAPRARPVRPTTRQPRQACTASPWLWPRNWRPRA